MFHYYEIVRFPPDEDSCNNDWEYIFNRVSEALQIYETPNHPFLSSKNARRCLACYAALLLREEGELWRDPVSEIFNIMKTGRWVEERAVCRVTETRRSGGTTTTREIIRPAKGYCVRAFYSSRELELPNDIEAESKMFPTFRGILRTFNLI